MECVCKYSRILADLKDFPPLIFRLALTYGFSVAVQTKWLHTEAMIHQFAAWGFIFPGMMLWLAMILEALGVVSLFFGIATRSFSILLTALMLVVTFVHYYHGQPMFVPLSYLMALFSLMVSGAGRYSLDSVFCPHDSKFYKGNCCNM